MMITIEYEPKKNIKSMSGMEFNEYGIIRESPSYNNDIIICADANKGIYFDLTGGSYFDQKSSQHFKVEIIPPGTKLSFIVPEPGND